MPKRPPFTRRDYTIDQVTKTLSRKGVKFLPQSDDNPYRRVVIGSAKNIGLQSLGMIDFLRRSGFIIVKEEQKVIHHLSSAAKKNIREALRIKKAKEVISEGVV